MGGGKARAVERFEAAARAVGVEPAVVRFDEDTRTAGFGAIEQDLSKLDFGD